MLKELRGRSKMKDIMFKFSQTNLFIRVKEVRSPSVRYTKGPTPSRNKSVEKVSLISERGIEVSNVR